LNDPQLKANLCRNRYKSARLTDRHAPFGFPPESMFTFSGIPGSALNQGDVASLYSRSPANFQGLGAGQDPVDVGERIRRPLSIPDSMNRLTQAQSLALLSFIQGLLQEYVNHIDPCPKLSLCERIEPLHELRGESEAEHDAVLLCHVSTVMRCHALCQDVACNQVMTLPSIHCVM
jgi:hypothetical protein